MNVLQNPKIKQNLSDSDYLPSIPEDFGYLSFAAFSAADILAKNCRKLQNLKTQLLMESNNFASTPD